MKRYNLGEDGPRWGVVDGIRQVLYPKHTDPCSWYEDGYDVFTISADLESFDVM